MSNHSRVALVWTVVFLCAAFLLGSGCGKKKDGAETAGTTVARPDAAGSDRAGGAEAAASQAPAITATSRTTKAADGEADVAKVRDRMVAAREAMDRARTEAEGVGAHQLAKSEFLAANNKATGALYEADGAEYEKAIVEYNAAERMFRDALEAAKKATSDVGDVEKLIAEVRAARDEAAQLGVDADNLKAADDALTEANRLLANRAPGKARDEATRARDDLTVAVASHKNQETLKPEAEALRLEVQTGLHDLERSTDINGQGVEVIDDARAEARAGDRAMSAAQYAKAIRHYREAQGLIRDAIAHGRVAKGDSDKPADASSGDEAGKDTADGGAGNEPDDTAGGEPETGSTDESSEATEVAQPDESLRARLAKHFSAPKGCKDGVVQWVYTDGGVFSPDCTIIGGADKNVSFGGAFLPGRDYDYAVAGHTRGHLLHNVVFEDEVTVRLKVIFEFLVEEPQFQIVILSDGKNFYSSNFGANIEQWLKGKSGVKSKPEDKSYWLNPNKWVLKGTEVTMELRCKRSPKGVNIQAYYRGKKCAEWEGEKIRSGKVGILWENTRFLVQEFDIKGRPSPAWLETLEK